MCIKSTEANWDSFFVRKDGNRSEGIFWTFKEADGWDKRSVISGNVP